MTKPLIMTPALWREFLRETEVRPDLVLDGVPCRIWTGAVDHTPDYIDANGSGGPYGMFHGRRAHRVSFKYHYYDISESIRVRHRCDRTLCVEPLHLTCGTDHDNQMDAVLQGKIHRGKRPRFLTEENAREIRSLYATGNYTQQQLAELFSASRPHVVNIIRNRRHAVIDNEVVLAAA